MKWLDSAWWRGLETVIGLDCPTGGDGAYRLLRVQKDQHRIKILETKEIPNSEALLSELDRFAKEPIVLILTREFVMERILPPDQAKNPVAAMLGAAADDQAQFEGNIIPADSGSSLVALIRSDTIQSHLDRLAHHASRVIRAVCTKALGLYLMPQADPNFFEGTSVMQIDGNCYEFRSGQLVRISSQFAGSEVIREAELCKAHQVPEGFAIGYAAILQTWVLGASNSLKNAKQEISLPPHALKDRWQSHLTTSMLKNVAVASAIAMGIWFIALASLRIQGERRLHELEEQYAQNLPVLNAIQGLDEKIADREELGKKFGNQTLKPSRASFYLDRIAARCPSEIRLKETIVGPNEQDRKQMTLPDDLASDMIIAGESNLSAPISQFSDSLQNWLLEQEGTQPTKASLAVVRSEIDFQSGLYQFIFSISFAGNSINSNP